MDIFCNVIFITVSTSDVWQKVVNALILEIDDSTDSTQMARKQFH